MVPICSLTNECFNWNSYAISTAMFSTGEMHSMKGEIWKDPNTVVEGIELIWHDTLHSSSRKFQTHEIQTDVIYWQTMRCKHFAHLPHKHEAEW